MIICVFVFEILVLVVQNFPCLKLCWVITNYPWNLQDMTGWHLDGGGEFFIIPAGSAIGPSNGRVVKEPVFFSLGCIGPQNDATGLMGSGYLGIIDFVFKSLTQSWSWRPTWLITFFGGGKFTYYTRFCKEKIKFTRIYTPEMGQWILKMAIFKRSETFSNALFVLHPNYWANCGEVQPRSCGKWWFKESGINPKITFSHWWLEGSWGDLKTLQNKERFGATTKFSKDILGQLLVFATHMFNHFEGTAGHDSIDWHRTVDKCRWV